MGKVNQSFNKMMSPTKLVWVGIIVDLIIGSQARPSRVNVDLDVNINLPKANQASLDGSSDRVPLEGPQMDSDALKKTVTPEQIEDIKKAAGSRKIPIFLPRMLCKAMHCGLPDWVGV